MAQLFLGAINKQSGEYVYPKIANKKDEYICTECNKDLILVKGESRVHHFRHKVDKINPCQHYSKPSESQIHKDAKMLMKSILEKKHNVQFIRECVSCKITTEIKLSEITEDSIITLEHRFKYQDELKIADVAHTVNGEIKAIYEICNTHKTSSENRPEPWVEIDANSLLTLINKNNEPFIIKCIRCEKCDKCENLSICKRCDGTGYDESGNCLICNIIKKEKVKGQCYMCQGSGTSYWSDDVYGPCLECCCIDCEEFLDECKCIKCQKCNCIYIKQQEHTCEFCKKCGKEYYNECDCSYLKDEEHKC
jgi:hypothetical protein